MPAAQVFSGTGDPNSVVVGNPGDVYQDETGSLWVKTLGPGTAIGWVQLRGAAVMALPAIWRQDNVPAGTTAPAPISGSNFSELSMIRSGSIIGLRVRLTQGVAAGSIEVRPTINGVPTGLSVFITGGDDTDYNTIGVGALPYVQGDLVGVQFTTSADFAPTTADLEVWLETTEDAT